ncbi:MAG TPA: alpha/beta hydrolase [Phycisphaerae bacterium]|nr:alpha/beta hydrolase [Phycisphaerae bacterium]
MRMWQIGAVAGIVGVAAAGLLMGQAREASPAAGSASGGGANGLHLENAVAGIKPIVSHLRDRLPSPNPAQDKEWGTARDDGTSRIYDVNEPGMVVYLPPEGKRTGVALIACPGGAYTHLTRVVGADGCVEAFVPQGVAVISLMYRLKPPSKDVEADALADGRQCVRIVRQHAKEWGIDPDKIGMVGWSAGGNLILNMVSHQDDAEAAGKGMEGNPLEAVSDRLDFAILLSPWPDGKGIEAYLMPKDPPPAFIGNAEDDRTAPVTFARAVAEEWKKAGGKVEMDIVPTGGHGAFELGTGTAKDWPEKVTPWLKEIGMLK